MKDKTVQDIYEELTTTYQNLKAEIFVTEIIENSNLNIADIDIFNKSTFSRSYRRDVIDFRIDPYSPKSDKLQFDLARNSLYDTLPEGLFHEPVNAKSDISFKELHQKQKKEEREARSFFLHLENEFFTQKVNIEKKERLLINQFANLKTDFLLNFWKIDKNIPSEYSIKLIQLLPYVHRISGEKELTATCLEKIIEEKVTIRSKHQPISEKTEDITTDPKLGVDFVLELKETVISYPVWEIIIGPLSKEKIDDFGINSATQKFITTFCNYFIPIEIESKIKLTCSKTDNTFILNKTNGPTMGLTTMI